MQAIFDNNYRPVVVAPAGEGQPLATMARRMKLDLLQPEKVNDPIFLAHLGAIAPDLFVLAGYNQILHTQILGIPSHGTINLHGGKLPEYRGTAPINWQIINGEAQGGCCILYVDEGIDTGDIIEQQLYDITLEDNAATAVDKTLKIFPPMLLRTLGKISKNEIKATKQDLNSGSHYTRRYDRDGRIDWKTMSAVQVHNLVRALVPPYPGAFALRGTERITIVRTRLLEQRIMGIPGRIPLKREQGAIAIAADRGLLIEKVLVEGQELDAREFFRIGDDLA